MPSPRRAGPAVLLGLGALLVASFALRVWVGSAELHSGHHFDERYTLHNVAAHLVHGRWKPANAYYPSLSYLPLTAVLAVAEPVAEAFGWEALDPLRETSGAGDGADGGAGRQRDPFAPAAYLLGRGLSALFGTLSLLLVYRLGRRLWGPAEGLLAALLLAAAPAHITSSALIKPDILVLLLTVWAADLAWSATAPGASGGWGGYLRTGVVVGLAVAAKYTGVGACLPLVALTFLAGEGGVLRRLRRNLFDRGRWARLTAAGAAAVAAFFLLNPWVGLLFRYLFRLGEIYEAKGEIEGGSHLGVAIWELRYLVRHHGWVVACLALASLAALAWTAFRRRGAGAGGSSEDGGPAEGADGGRAAVLVLSFALGYSALYVAATTLFKGQNYIAVLAFTSLAAGWGIASGARWAGRRWSALRRGWISIPAGAAALVFLFVPTVTSAYTQRVPSTHEQAARLLSRELSPLGLSWVAFERVDEPLRLSWNGFRPGMTVVSDLAKVSAERLNRADAEVFPSARLEGPSSELYLRRVLDARGSDVRRIEPAFLKARGPGLVVVLHPWRRVGAGEGGRDLRRTELSLGPGRRGRGEGADSGGEGPLLFRVPLEAPAEEGQLFSLFLDASRPAAGEGPAAVQIRAGGELSGRLPLRVVRGRGRNAFFLSPRFRLPPGTRSFQLHLHGAEPIEGDLKGTVARWE